MRTRFFIALAQIVVMIVAALSLAVPAHAGEIPNKEYVKHHPHISKSLSRELLSTVAALPKCPGMEAEIENCKTVHRKYTHASFYKGERYYWVIVKRVPKRKVFDYDSW